MARSRGDREAISDCITRPGWALVIPWDPSVAIGGVSQVVLNLAHGLKIHGTYEPTVIVQEWASVRPRIELRNEVRYVFIRMRSRPDRSVRFLKRMLHPFFAWREKRRFAQMLRALNIKIINFHYPTLVAEPFVAKPYMVSSWRLKVIFSLHGTDIAGAARQGYDYRTRYVRMLARGDALVAVSHGFANLMAMDLAPELIGKICVIYNGVSAETIKEFKPIDTPLPARYILNVAAFEEGKGQRYLLDAFSRIADDYPGLHLVIAGRTAGALDELIQQISQLGLEKRILLLRDLPHNEIGALFASAAIFCQSSVAEAFGIVVLEAGVFGLPVVATRVGGAPEILRDNEDGMLVPCGDAAQLAAAIRALLDAPVRAAALGASLRDRVLVKFSWRQAVEHYVVLAAGLRES